MRKEKKFKFFNEGKKVCEVVSDYDNAKPFEVLMRRFCRYASRFGYNVQYEAEFMEPQVKTMKDG